VVVAVKAGVGADDRSAIHVYVEQNRPIGRVASAGTNNVAGRRLRDRQAWF
jgi:hypothetical protein